MSGTIIVGTAQIDDSELNGELQERGPQNGGSRSQASESQSSEDKPAERKAERGVLYGMFRGMVFAVALLIIAVCAAGFVVPRFVNAVPLAVLTGSMEPVYSPGDLVISQKTEPADVEIGDIVTFQPVSGDPTLITHRVIAKTIGADGSTITTQGDANGAADEPIVPEQVKGKVIYSIPYLGHLSAALDAGTKSMLAAGAGVVLIGYAIFVLAGAGIKRRRRDGGTGKTAGENADRDDDRPVGGDGGDNLDRATS